MKKHFNTFCLFVLSFCSSLIISSCSNSNRQPSTEVTTKLRNVETIEEARDLIEGTTWHYTENLSSSNIGFWVKVSFKNGQFTSYYAQPSDGKWTESNKKGKYKIEEGRYSNTGERYIAVKWEGQGYMGLPFKYTLDLNSFQLAVQNPLPDLNTFRLMPPDYGTMEFGDYEWN